ncbi:MAG: FIST N-terminal domain-containing protein, partial [Planctomycetota bacterium]
MPTPSWDPILRASSTRTDPEAAVAELAERLDGVESAGRVFFCSPRYDFEALAHALRERLGDAPLVGCTTAGEVEPGGEIGPGGYLGCGGISITSFPADDF